jgi:hypothetical protein
VTSADGCPSDERLASMLDGSIAPADRDAVEHHADGCARCSETLVHLARAYLDVGASETVPDSHRPAVVAAREAVRYRLGSMLGEGGMGVVYRAHDRVLQRDVAVKLMRVDAADPVAQRSRILREGRAMARVSDPHVVPVFDVGEDADGVFIVMELVRGETLRAHLRTPRSFEHVRARFVEAARGLHAAHEAGVVHRDFKPENVLIGADGRARVTDFGIARPLSPENTPISTRWAGDAMTAGIAGTPAYMAPEQLAGEPVSAATDQYALAVTLYEALYGERPFLQRTSAERLAAMRRGPVSPPSKRTDVPRWVWPILARALSPEPAARYPTIAAFADALVAGEPIGVQATLGLHAVSLVVLTVVHVLLVAMVIAFINTDGSGAESPDEAWIWPTLLWIGWMFLCGFIPLGVFAAPALLWGIVRRRPWAYPLAYVYSVIALTTGLGTPYAIYAMVTMRRREVRAVFGRT